MRSKEGHFWNRMQNWKTIVNYFSVKKVLYVLQHTKMHIENDNFQTIAWKKSNKVYLHS